jgi:hypothetical protein
MAQSNFSRHGGPALFLIGMRFSPLSHPVVLIQGSSFHLYCANFTIQATETARNRSLQDAGAAHQEPVQHAYNRKQA